MQCAQCSSGDLQKLSLVYESGTSHINTHTSGVGVGFGGGGLGFGVGGGHTRGTQISTTAAKAAPPIERRYMKRVICGAFFAMYGLNRLMQPDGMLVGGALLAIAVMFFWSAMRTIQWNRQVWPELMQLWDASYLCIRCGFMGTPRMTQPIKTPSQPPIEQRDGASPQINQARVIEGDGGTKRQSAAEA